MPVHSVESDKVNITKNGQTLSQKCMYTYTSSNELYNDVCTLTQLLMNSIMMYVHLHIF